MTTTDVPAVKVGETYTVGKTGSKVWTVKKVSSDGDITLSTGEITKILDPGHDWLSKLEKADECNSYGLPVFNTAAMTKYLSDLPIGSEFKTDSLNSLTWVKAENGLIDGFMEPASFASAIVEGSGWTAHKKGLHLVKFDNDSGVPIKNETVLTAFLHKQTVGTTFGTSKFTATKVTGASWKDNQSGKVRLSVEMAATLMQLPPSMKDELQVKFVPEPVADADLAPNVLLENWSDFSTYYLESHSGNANYLSIGQTIGESITPKYKQGSDQRSLGSYFGPWSNTLEAMTQPHVFTAVAQAIVNVIAARSSIAKTTVAKSQCTKMVNRLKAFEKVLLAFKKLSEQEVLNDDDFKAFEFNFTSAKTSFPFALDPIISYARTQAKTVKYAKDKKALGFNIDNGSPADYLNFFANLKSDKDYSFVEWLKGDTHVLYTLCHYAVGDPDYDTSAYYNQAFQKAAKNKTKHECLEVVKAAGGISNLVPKHSVNGAGFPAQPGFVSSESWTMACYLLSTLYTETNISEYGQEHLNSWFGFISGFVPVEALTNLMSRWNGGSSSAKRLLAYFALSGMWYSDMHTYTDSVGPIPLLPGMRVYDGATSSEMSSDYYFLIPRDLVDQDSHYRVVAVEKMDHSITMTNVTPSKIDVMSPIYTAPYVITHGESVKDGHNFNKGDWDALVSYEESVETHPLTGAQAVDMRAVLAGTGYTPTTLSPKASALLVAYPHLVNIITYKESKKAYVQYRTGAEEWPYFVKENTEDGSTIRTTLLGISDLNNDSVVQSAIVSLNKDDRKAAITLFNPDYSDDYAYPSDECIIMLRNLIVAFVKKQIEVSTKSTATLGVSGDLMPLPNQHMGGGQKKTYFADADGNVYMGKPNNVERFRPDSEQAAGDVARLFNFKVPSSAVREIDGIYTHVQQVLDHDGDLTYASWADLDDKTLSEALQGHVLDWAVSNHDAHGGNFLKVSGGIYKIDLGQAWKALGQDQLTVGWELSGNYGGVWYEGLYRAVQKGKVDKALLDKVTKTVLLRAYNVSTRRDDEFRAILGEAFKNRTYYPGTNKADFTELAMGRKANTFTDFLKFYKNLYAAGKYEFPFTEESFKSSTLNDTDAHTKVSPAFAAEVVKNRIWGKSLFFNSLDIEDTHALFYCVNSATGNGLSLHIDMKIRDAGDKRIKNWISKQTGVPIKTVAEPAPVKKKSKKGASSGLPGTQDYLSALVAYAKTTSFHAEDGAYNKETNATAMKYKKQLQVCVTAFEAEWAANPSYVYHQGGNLIPAFETGHQQFAWYTWAKETVKHFEAVEEAQKTAQKSPKVPSTAEYVAPAEIDLNIPPKIVETAVTQAGLTFSKYSDLNYVGSKGPMSEASYNTIKQNAGATIETFGEEKPVVKAKPAPKKVVQVTVPDTFSVGTGSFCTPQTTDAGNDGIATFTGWQNYSHSGYQITSPAHKGIKIFYVLHSQTKFGTNYSNRGRLQVQVDEWDGAEARIEEVLDILHTMGVEFDEATEESMELFFWRHLSNIMEQRYLNYQEQKALSSLQKVTVGTSTELDERKAIFTELWGKSIVDKADYRPHFGNHRFHVQTAEERENGNRDGRPYWMRPDFDLADWLKKSGGVLSSRNDNCSLGVYYIIDGGYASNEEKIRYNGSWGQAKYSTYGLSSATSDRNKGSSQFAYIRQGQWLSDNQAGMYVEPQVMGRTHNYSIDHDAYGSTATRDEYSPFNLDAYIGHSSGHSLPGKSGTKVKYGSNGGNETMVKYGWSLWEDVAIIQAASEPDRTKLLQYFKNRGITEIRGIPVEERIVTQQAQAAKTMQKIWDLITKESK